MSASYELSENDGGEYRFVLKAGNGEAILTSELYEEKSGALNGINSVRSNSADDSRYVLLTASNGNFYFNLRAGNNQVIGTSQLYASEDSRATGIASVKANGPTAPVEDLS